MAFAGSKTIPTLTADICDVYERPAAASAMLDNRIKCAEEAQRSWSAVRFPIQHSTERRTFSSE
jgi:hypothetical protein